MTVDKKINYEIQGGVKNYLGKQKEVKAPIKWKSSPDHPETELAYITKAEKNLLIKKDLHGSLKGGVNRGPSGIMSLNGFGSADESQNVGGGDISSAETGGGRSGMSQSDADDFRSAAIAAGAGQRVNPGFFDSRNVVSPEELARAKAFAKTSPFAKTAMRKTRGGGILGFLRSGGILGNIVRSLGQRFGLGKKFNQPTYDMSEGNRLRLFGQVPEDFEDDPKISNVSFTANDPNNILNQIPVDTGIKTIAPNNILANTGDAFDYFNLDDKDLSGIKTIPSGSPFDNPFKAPTPADDFLEGLPQDTIDNLMAEVTQDDINKSKTRTFKAMDYDTYKMINPNSQVSPFEFEQLKEGNITEPGIYTV